MYRLIPNEATAVAVEAVAVGERFELDAYLRAQRNLGRTVRDTDDCAFRDPAGNLIRINQRETA